MYLVYSLESSSFFMENVKTFWLKCLDILKICLDVLGMTSYRLEMR